MSYNSIHTGYPIKGGYRRSQLIRCTVAELSHTTWAELKRPDPYLNGNTKWQEMPCVAFFFKNGFVDNKAGNDIGFTGSRTSAGSSLKGRLDKVNTQALLSFGTKLMMSGLLKRDWAWLLNPKRKTGRTDGRGGGGPMSKSRITFSKAICEQAVEKYGFTKVSMKLRVDMKVIAFWLNYNN